MEGVFQRINLPVGEKIEKGVARLSTYEFKHSNDPLFNLRAIMNGGLMYMTDDKYVSLSVENELVMSDTRMEKTSNREFVNAANGRVLIAGLGIGLIIHNLKSKIESGVVTEIIVIEKFQDVIDLVSPFYQDIPNLKIICSDIFDYPPQEKFDTIYFDIWPLISEDNLTEIRTLHNRFKSKLNRENPNCWMDSWMKHFLQRQKARDRRRYGW